MPRRAAIAVAALVVAPLMAGGAHARLVPCRQGADAGQVADALDRIRRSVDPCGESAQVLAVVDRLERCAAGRYEICTDDTASRNLLEPHGEDEPGTIIWNPDLRSELERGCDGDPARPVMRDPVASLLHELVHAVDDCEGRDPGTRELEAVRVENIYRRAAGLCQRSAYGEDALAAETVRRCGPERCDCSIPSAPQMARTVGDRRAIRSTPPGEIPSALAGDGLVGR